MSKLLRQIVFLVLMGVLVAVSGGCGGGSDSKYPVVNADGAILPKDPTNWTAAEKSAWINQGTLLLDQMVSTEFRGRMAGDIGYEQAAMWAATNFKAWGLEPLDGSYFQDFNISYSMPINKSPVIKILVDGKVWKSTENGDYIDDEFVKDIMSAHGTNTGTVRSKLTFLGYGIDATAANVYAHGVFILLSLKGAA
ncbi:hypothetical protein [uncultured Cloacibacillus sp.]|uniref:hypothetical protein n=1 Tax=uncultured Cloacibacillus sp. TaxID=889794 RepID=UPI00258CF6B1|nr:hypothetical protein [uncultured Cloacibacillus sp.]